MADKGKKSIKKRVVAIITTVAILAGASVALVKTGVIDNIINFFRDPEITVPSELKKLETPKDLTYDQFTGKLSWSPDLFSDGYVVNVNGVEHKTETNFLTLENPADALDVKIKSIGDNVHYKDSDWSETKSFIKEENKESFEYMYNYLKSTVENNEEFLQSQTVSHFQINNIISFSFNERSIVLATDANVIFGDSGKMENTPYQITLNFKNAINNLNDIIDAQLDFIGGSPLKYAPYNSANYLIQSRSFDGEVQKYYEEGYVVTILDSFTTKYNEIVDRKCSFNIYMNLKLEKDGITKFVSTGYKVVVPSASNEKDNYTVKVANPNARTVTEFRFYEQVGVNKEFFLELLKQNGVTNINQRSNSLEA